MEPTQVVNEISIITKDSNGTLLRFKVKRSTTFKRICAAYLEYNKLRKSPTIIFTYNGKIIQPDDTPDMLKMKDDDQILIT